MKRGEVWLATLDPTVGAEIHKTRPVLVISPDDLNDRLRTIIVAPLTSGSHPARFRVSTVFKRRAGLILLDQIRTLDSQRLVKRLGRIDATALTTALRILTEMFHH